ncbi:MAG: AmmeMemoRadiSam system protein B [Thalassobaculaceae bacterium]|nr:AmmeMemoRadiSam system protein B [Thalassobaculaceae bacterium]
MSAPDTSQTSAFRSGARVRAPEVAGMFYPDGHNALADTVERCLAAARPDGGVTPKVLVAPHAGYRFSGDIAGTAYAGLRARSEDITRIVLLGPAHRVAFKGITTTSADAWATPLGTVPVDWAALRTVLHIPGVTVEDSAFVQEHSLEVHLPFIQRVFDNAVIVPLLVGDAPPALVSQVVEALWGGPETLIVVSSDLSHFHDYDTARKLDGATAASIELLRGDRIDGQGACGHRALAGVLDQARKRDLRATALDVRNSGDMVGGRERVVGYGAFGLEYAESARIGDDDRRRLVEAACFGVTFGLQHGRAPSVGIGSGLSPSLSAQRAAFVTLTLDGNLRGCIGSVIAHRPLIADVADNAFKAAFADRRFAQLTPEEAERMEVSVSVLSTPRPMSFADEGDLVRQTRPDIDGLIMSDRIDGRDHRGIFLPSVWSGIPKAEDFVRRLKNKSGLSMDHWSPGLTIHRYTTESFGGSFREVAA